MQTSPSNLIPACLIFAGLCGFVMVWCAVRAGDETHNPTPKPGERP